MKAFQAYSTHGRNTAQSPKAAAIQHFQQFPKARKCNIISGETDGAFFVVTYGRASEGKWPSSYKNVTKKTSQDLPG